MNREDRTRVQTLLNKNVVVEAGAGTGKTTLLIDRLCLCVLAQAVPVEKLVALTFTEKAAAEIKTRFIFKLQHLIEAISSNKEDRTLTLLRQYFELSDTDLLARAQTALSRLDRASIGTIHSFCAEILKTFPLEASLSPNAQIDAGQKAAELFEARWNHFLDEELGEQAARPEQWKELLSEVSLTDLKSFAQELSRLKPVEYDYYSHQHMLSNICQEKAERAAQLYANYVPHGKKPRALEQALGWAEKSLRTTAAFLMRQPFEEIAPMGSIPSTVYKDWDEADYEEARGLILFAQKVTPHAQHLFLLAKELVSPLAKLVHQDCEAQGVLSFDDLIIKTRNLLQQNLYVRRLLKEKITALFIDEFQDTDPIQGELLLFLAEEKPAAASRWQDVHLQPGKLFVVGDPKQSIYRFRGADITAYELFTDLILKQGGEKCFLRRNFRSTSFIVEIANQICSRAMVQQTAFQPAYEPIFTSASATPQDVSWLFITAPVDQTAQADDYRHNQAEQIALWIERNVGRLPLADGHLLAYKDIALLTRVGTTSRIYTDALRRHHIAFNTETDKDFFHKQEINDLILLLRLIADNTDKIALAGVLRSPFGGQTDQNLYQLSQAGELSLTLLAKQDSTKALVAHIQELTQLAGRVSIETLIQTIFTKTFFPEACAAAYDGEKTLAYLQQFCWLAAKYEAEHTASLVSFLSDIRERLAQGQDEITLPPSDQALDAVSISTVHKSKGLEFPVVILADLSRKESVVGAHPADHLFSWQYTMYGLRVGKICDINLAFLEEEQKKHSQCEEIRILYVALTRAKERLILVADGRKGTEKAVAAFANAGLFPDGKAASLPTAQVSFPVTVTYVPYADPRSFIYTHLGTKQPKITYTEEQLSDWKAAHQARLVHYQELKNQHKKDFPSDLEPETIFTLQQQEGAELGTLCHRALELLVNRKVQGVSQACEQAAHEMGVPALLLEAKELLVSFVKSPLFTQIQAAHLLACEMPFVTPITDGVQSGIMDVVLEQADGSIWVVDYKTDQVISGEEGQRVQEKYQGQLRAYLQAAQKLFPDKKVRCSAVFLRTFAAVDL